jgi:hypothetical protein
MAFKIKDGIRIGTIDFINNSATTLKLLDGVTGSPTFQLTLKTLALAANRQIDFPDKTGTVALTSDLSSFLTAEADTLQTVTGRGASSNIATITLSASTASSNTTTGTLVVTGGVGIGGNLNVGGNAVITGNLTVNGTTTTVNSTTISVDDKNLELGSVASPTDTTADGGGITLKGSTDKTFNWVDATDAWTSSEHIALAAGKTAIFTGGTSGTITLTPTAIAGTTTLTLPATTGTLALVSQIPTVNDASFTLTVAEDGTTGNSVYITTGTGFTANDATNTTYDIHVGAALSALANIMTGATSGFVKKTAADTYSIDTSTYLTAQNSDIDTITVTDTDSGYTWAATGSVVSDAVGDTVTFVSGSGININVDATLDAIKISTDGDEYAFSEGVTKTISAPTANTAYEADSWSKTVYRACKYVLGITQGTFFESCEIMVFYNGSTAELTEYAVFSTAAASEMTFTVVATGANVQLMLATPTATTNVVVKAHRTLIKL